MKLYNSKNSIPNNSVNDNTIKPHNHKTHWSNNVKSIYFEFSQFDINTFTTEIINQFKPGITYSLLMKVRYNDGSYAMIGNQIGLKLISTTDNDSIKKVYNGFINMTKRVMENYGLEGEDIDLLQLIYVTITDNPKLSLNNINKVKLNKEFFNVKETKFQYSSQFLPLTMNHNYYGKLVSGSSRFIYIDIINKQKNILDNTKLQPRHIDSMYLYNDKYIILNYKLYNKNKAYLGFSREVYDISSGIFYLKVEDIDLKDKSFIRKIGNKYITFSDDKVVKVMTDVELSPIKPRIEKYKASSNPYIGSLDLETFVDTDGFSKVYALGFYIARQEPKLFYLGDVNTGKLKESPEDLLLRCFDELLTTKYDGYIFYVHNFGKFDAVFISHILKKSNLNKGFDHYILNPLFRDNRLLKLDIRIKKSSGFIKITIVDSYNLLGSSLKVLSENFNLEVTKGHFPHKFVTIDTLNYIGNTPALDYWININSRNNITTKEWDELNKPNWSLKEECLYYLKKDLISLFDVISTFKRYIFANYGLQITDALTISRLALNIFLSKYLKNSQLPIIKKKNMYSEIKKAHFGGVTEVYIPYGENLFYYDVNSLYPFASLNPIPSTSCTFIESFDTQLYIKDLFGYFYCEIETENNYLGLLPVHKDFELVMPNGKWKGWYFSEELKFASDNGYKIKVIKGYVFNKAYNVFDKYVNDLYKIKSESVGSRKVVSKSLLNNLLGRFGLNINKPITEIVNREKLEYILSTSKVVGFKNITENDFLLTYIPEPSKDICVSHDLNYIKVLNMSCNADSETDKEFNDVSLTTAAAITSYARIYMSRIKLDILKKDGKIYYTDTDSIVTDIPLNPELVGSKLGQFKLEWEIEKGYFISSKLYCLVVKNKAEDKSIVIKSKGAFKESLKLEDFINMYKGENVKAIKGDSKTNYEKGSVVIDTKPIELNHNSYKKREKIYIDNKWIDTTPIYFNQDT